MSDNGANNLREVVDEQNIITAADIGNGINADTVTATSNTGDTDIEKESVTDYAPEDVAVESGFPIKPITFTKEMAKRERIYQMTMSDARKLVDEGAITPEQYLAFETKMVAKYRPVFGRLFSELGND